MDSSSQEQEGKKKVTEVKTFPIPFALAEKQENITITTNTPSKPSKEQIINEAIKFHSEGNILEAAKSYQHLINQGFKDHRIFSNYGVILKNLGKLQEAELMTRKAIEINPDSADTHYNLGGIFIDLGKLKDAEISYRKAIKINPNIADAHYNLGGIFIDLGKLKDAEVSTRKAIKINPDLAKGYFSLSLLKFNDDSKIWQDKIFSETILHNKSKNDQIDIYFARANILHKEKNYKEGAKYLELANKLKLCINPSNSKMIVEKSKVLLSESHKEEINRETLRKYPASIFIVGMPRSGSTLLESIISMNDNINDLGEKNILEESFLKQKRNEQELSLAVLYWHNITNHPSELKITTNKWLYNYQYAGIISSQIPNAKIIHCYRHPLDNILSIYRTHFARGNEYSSSLIDCCTVYLNQEEVMTEYKNRWSSKIYDLNYDSLVSNPNQEIKSLISWLGWEWDDSYLTPHLNPRSVSTASSVQVRSPINSKSIGGWKNYKEMLKPAIEILTQTDRYRDLVS